MDAIPCAIYAAPAELFRCTVTKRISDDEQQYYIQLLHRVNAQSYTVAVASACDDLVALYHGEATESIEQRVLVTTISRQDLHQHCTLILAPEAEAPLYAAPAAILHDDDLRATASSAWLTYVRVLRRHACGSVTVRLAGQPHRVDDHRRSSTTTLTAQEFAQALAIGRRELNLATCDLLELVEAHAQAVTGRPVEHLAPVLDRDEEEDERKTHTPAAPSYPPEVVQMLHIEDRPHGTTQQPRCTAQLQQDDQEALPPVVTQPQTKLVESVYVPAEIAIEAIQQFTRHTGAVPLSRTLLQKAWLQAALCAIHEYQQQSHADQARLAIQDERLRVVLVSRVFRAARLVWVEPVGKPVGRDCPLTEMYRGYTVHVEKMIAA